ncbi:hypothetical protein Hanom_Chr13g01211221 [Helianthus anomalus]
MRMDKDAGNEENTGGVRELGENERQAAWAQIVDGHYNPSSTKSTKLRDPLYRYIHRVITYSLSQRHDSSGVVGLRDLVSPPLHSQPQTPRCSFPPTLKHALEQACYSTHPYLLRWVDIPSFQALHKHAPILPKEPMVGKSGHTHLTLPELDLRRRRRVGKLSKGPRSCMEPARGASPSRSIVSTTSSLPVPASR